MSRNSPSPRLCWRGSSRSPPCASVFWRLPFKCHGFQLYRKTRGRATPIHRRLSRATPPDAGASAGGRGRAGNSRRCGARQARSHQLFCRAAFHPKANASKKAINHEDVFTLHRILAAEVMDQGMAGRYRTIAVRVGRYVPPPPGDVSGADV